MKVAIMQPYFFPYLGYFQLINEVDVFVVYDDIKYTKKGWINRNRIISNRKEAIITIPLKKDSDFLKISERYIAKDFDKKRMIRLIYDGYKKSVSFSSVYPIVESIILESENNLFDYVYSSLLKICDYLNIKTQIAKSSSLNFDRTKKNQEMVISICNCLEADIYINPIGGTELYSREEFNKSGIDLLFLRSQSRIYKQNVEEFIPWLSIIDVLFMNTKDEVIGMLNKDYELITV